MGGKRKSARTEKHDRYSAAGFILCTSDQDDRSKFPKLETVTGSCSQLRVGDFWSIRHKAWYTPRSLEKRLFKDAASWHKCTNEQEMAAWLAHMEWPPGAHLFDQCTSGRCTSIQLTFVTTLLCLSDRRTPQAVEHRVRPPHCIAITLPS